MAARNKKPQGMRIKMPDGSIEEINCRADVARVARLLNPHALPDFTIDDPRIDIPDLVQQAQWVESSLSEYQAWVQEHGAASIATINGMLSVLQGRAHGLYRATNALMQWKSRAETIHSDLEAVVESLHDAVISIKRVFRPEMQDLDTLHNVKIPAGCKKLPRFQRVILPQLARCIAILESFKKYLAPTDATEASWAVEDVKPDRILEPRGHAFAITNDHAVILRCLSKEKGRPIQQADLLAACTEAGAIMCRQKLGQLLNELRRQQFVTRPRGQRGGEVNTPGGHAALTQFDRDHLKPI